jgi:hypothetical protein
MTSRSTILTLAEVARAIYEDADFDSAELERLALLATDFIKIKTGYDFSQDDPRESLATECAMQYVRQVYFGSKGYNKEHDYSLGICGLIEDLQVIAYAKLR